MLQNYRILIILILGLLCIESNGQTQLTTYSKAEFEQKLKELKVLSNASPDSAIPRYLDLISQSNLAGNPEVFAQIQYGLAKAFYIKSEYLKSLEYAQEGLWAAESINDALLKVYGLNACGIAYTMLGQEHKAINAHQKALKLITPEEHPVLWSLNLFNISISYEALSMADSSALMIDSCLQIALVHDDLNTQCKYLNHKGYLLLNENKFEEAERIFKQNLGNPSFNNKWEVQFATAGMARVKIGQGLFSEALSYGLRAYQSAKEINSTWDLQQVSKILAEAYEGLGNFKEALNYQQKHQVYTNNIFNEDREKEIGYHLLQEQELQNQILSAEKLAVEVKLKNRNFVLLFVSISGLIILLAVLVLLSLNKQSRKIQLELTQSNETKDKLFRIIAHDLKNPIGAIMNLTELMQDSLVDNDQEQMMRLVSSLHQSSRSGYDLLNNLLKWSQVQAGTLPFQPHWNLVSELFEETKALSHSAAELKGIQIFSKFPEGIEVYADPNMLKAILRNLLTNAIKFSYPKGHIYLLADIKPDCVTFCVKDEGIGIEKTAAKNLFSSQTSLSSKGTLKEEGHGIGLLLCKEFVNRHEGQIWVESKPGKGSKFYFSLPNPEKAQQILKKGQKKSVPV